MFAVLFFCMHYALKFGGVEASQDSVRMALLVIAVIVVVYVFGASLEDLAKLWLNKRADQ